MKIMCRYLVDNSPDPDTTADAEIQGRILFTDNAYDSPLGVPWDHPVVWEYPGVVLRRVLYLTAADDTSGRGYSEFKLWGKSLCTFVSLTMEMKATANPSYIPLTDLPLQAPTSPNITIPDDAEEIRAGEQEQTDYIHLGLLVESPPYGGEFTVLYYLSWKEIP